MFIGLVIALAVAGVLCEGVAVGTAPRSPDHFGLRKSEYGSAQIPSRPLKSLSGTDHI
jgi:hypothetical protein